MFHIDAADYRLMPHTTDVTPDDFRLPRFTFRVTIIC